MTGKPKEEEETSIKLAVTQTNSPWTMHSCVL